MPVTTRKSLLKVDSTSSDWAVLDVAARKVGKWDQGVLVWGGGSGGGGGLLEAWWVLGRHPGQHPPARVRQSRATKADRRLSIAYRRKTKNAADQRQEKKRVLRVRWSRHIAE